MRLLIICLSLCIAGSLQGQSKKELQAEVTRLKAEVARQQAEITELKKEPVVDLNDKHNKASYAFGILMANNIITQGADSLNPQSLNAGFRDVFTKKPLQITPEESMSIMQNYMQEVMQKKAEKMRAGSKAFLDENKNKEGVKVTPSGLQYKVITAGKGKTPTANSQVTVHYTGQLIDGTIFDSSVGGEPATFGVSQVIPGWTEALQLMKEGDKWMLYIPDTLAYGERGAGGEIPPYSTLVFEVELLKVN